MDLINKMGLAFALAVIIGSPTIGFAKTITTHKQTNPPTATKTMPHKTNPMVQKSKKDITSSANKTSKNNRGPHTDQEKVSSIQKGGLVDEFDIVRENEKTKVKLVEKKKAEDKNPETESTPSLQSAADENDKGNSQTHL